MLDLQTDYVDLFLIHWPVAYAVPYDPKVRGFPQAYEPTTAASTSAATAGARHRAQGRHDRVHQETWQAMEQLLDAGLCRHRRGQLHNGPATS